MELAEEPKQPLVNIGLLGHVANGKSSLVRAITGEKTARNDSRCMRKGTENREMTVQIGYSNAKIYECTACPKPYCYTSCEGSRSKKPACTCCKSAEFVKLVTYVSFVDAPGHRQLMRNMISGSTVMDAAILVTDSTFDGQQVQTIEHLTAAEIVGIKNWILIAQNKIDLLLEKDNRAELLKANQQLLTKLVERTAADTSVTPIIPTSFSPVRQINLQLVLQMIVERAIPNPHPAYAQYPLFVHCVRSFDINVPACVGNSEDDNHAILKGSVLGGTIMTGTLKIGDVIEIRPGRKNAAGEWIPLQTTVTSLYTGSTPLQEARPGGLIGIGTTLDPYFSRSDMMVGMCAGAPGRLPDPVQELDLKLYLLTQGIGHDQEVQAAISKPKVGDVYQIAVGSATVYGKITTTIRKRTFSFQLSGPVCPVPGQDVPLSKMLDGAWTIVGKGELVSNQPAPPVVVTPRQLPNQTYDELLSQTLEENTAIEGVDSKLCIPAPKLVKDGGAKLLWLNFTESCKAMKRDKESVRVFFAEELSTQITLDGKSHMVIHGKNRFTNRHIQQLIIKYINAFVKCPSCASNATILRRDKGSKHTQLLCKKCGSEFLR